MDRMMDIAVVVGAMCDVSLLSLWCLREDRYVLPESLFT